MSETPTPPPLPPRAPPVAQPIPYATPVYHRNPATARQTLRWLAIGFGIGSVVSAALWLPLWHYDKSGDTALVLGLMVIGLKFILGITLLCFAGWRALGGGVLLSIVLGFMIFFGACATSANFH